MDYDYDLISGNVHKVEYQNGQADEWNHRYEYDADNRITQVETSTNKIFWDKDAQYKYYAHGPLARTEIGDNQVQGCDYVYTLQGWIKGVNSNTLNENNDPGKDGNNFVTNNPNKKFARDVYGFSLGYFTNDYLSIEAANQGTNSFTASITGSDVEANRNDLFNGNIGSMITTITNPVTREILPLGNSYKYDQLNRLLQAVSYNNLDLNTSNSAFNSFGIGGSQMYYNSFTYDENGNILTQWRKDNANSEIDSLHYKYAKDANGKMIQNRLYHVNDRTNYDANDIDDMGAFDGNLTLINQNNNYSYSEIGELERDLQEEIDEIIWRVDGKVKEVRRTAGSTKNNIKYDYDAYGNRVAKHLFDNNNFWLKSIFYVRGANGNVISIYEMNVEDSVLNFDLKEQHIYGSSRLGIRNPNIEMISSTVSAQSYARELGLSQYEISNHLGNVLSVISDKKTPIENIIVGGEVDYFVAEIISSSDYSPFGTSLNERDFNSDKFRYGFSGMEKDDEIKGKGNSYDFGARIYDCRLGRFLSVDPVSNVFKHLSPYNYAENKPIVLVDVKGLGGVPPTKHRLYIYNDNTTDKQVFKDAVTYLQQSYLKNNSAVGVEKIKAAKGGLDITTYINSFDDNTISHVDIASHGGSEGLWFQWGEPTWGDDNPDNDKENSFYMQHPEYLKQNFYKDQATEQNDNLRKGTDQPLSSNASDLNYSKFTSDAVIEIHGCGTAGDLACWADCAPIGNTLNDNLVINMSKNLYAAGKTNAVVIGHIGPAGPKYVDFNGSQYPDYRQNTRRVYWNGHMIYETKEAGEILQSTIQEKIELYKKEHPEVNESQTKTKTDGG